jgi:hypothetical protein
MAAAIERWSCEKLSQDAPRVEQQLAFITSE